MPSIAILREVQQVYNVSESPDSLAERQPLVSGALVTSREAFAIQVTLLEVLGATKIAPFAGLNPASA